MTPPKTKTLPAAKKAAAPAAKPQPPESGAATEVSPKPPTGKLAIIASMVATPQGATIAQLAEATGWQTHSVRGAIAGALKLKHGLTIVSEKTEAGRFYRLPQASA